MVFLLWQGVALALFALLLLTNSGAVFTLLVAWSLGGYALGSVVEAGRRQRRFDRRRRRY